MKVELFNANASNLWKKITSHSATEQLTIEIGLYKKLLNFAKISRTARLLYVGFGGVKATVK